MFLDPTLGDAAWFASLESVDAESYLGRAAVMTEHGPILPNCHEWLPGDVVLFQTLPGDKMNVVQSLQVPLLSAQARIWVHVGILDSELVVWDAHLDGDVRRRPLSEVLREQRVLGVRRLKDVTVDRAALVDSLLTFSNDKYRAVRLRTIGALQKRLILNVGTTAPRVDDAFVVCSTFLQKVLSRTVKRDLLAGHFIALPGDFAVDSDFEWVPARWCRP